MKFHKQELILALLILIYIIYFSITTHLRYENFYTGRFDLGHMTQAVWNTSQGRIFQASDSYNEKVNSRLAGHADFILILLAPFYFFWSDPRMLTYILTIVLAMGAIFVYLIAKEILKNKNLSLLLAFSYLMYPALQYNNLYDFHAVSLATTFLLGAFYFLMRKKYVWVISFLFLSALTKEHVWLTTALFGGYIFLREKVKSTKALGIAIFLISLLTFYFLIWHAIPNARGGEEHFAISYYSEFGDSPARIATNILFSPQQVVSTVFEKSRLDYLKQLFFPLGFLSLFSPLYLIFALPEFAITLLSNNPQFHQIYYQYSSTITPFVFISAIYGLKKLIKWLPQVSLIRFQIFIMSSLLISCYLIGPLPFSKKANIAMLTHPQINKEIIDNYLKNIPENYSVSATNNLGSHLSHREIIFNVPTNMEKADMVLFLDGEKEMIESMKDNLNYVKDFEKDDFIVFKKRTNL